MNGDIVECARVGQDAFIDQYAATQKAIKVPCGDCKAMLWQSLTTRRLKATPVCSPCAKKRAATAPYIPLRLPESVEAANWMNAEYRNRN